MHHSEAICVSNDKFMLCFFQCVNLKKQTGCISCFWFAGFGFFHFDLLLTLGYFHRIWESSCVMNILCELCLVILS